MQNEYILHGATFKCSCGSCANKLAVSTTTKHNIQGKLYASEGDKISGLNIPSFGHCSAMDDPCVPQPMQWQEVHPSVKVMYQRVLLGKSFLPCGKGGVIQFVDSNQSDEEQCAAINETAEMFYQNLTEDPEVGEPGFWEEMWNDEYSTLEREATGMGIELGLAVLGVDAPLDIRDMNKSMNDYFDHLYEYLHGDDPRIFSPLLGKMAMDATGVAVSTLSLLPVGGFFIKLAKKGIDVTKDVYKFGKNSAKILRVKKEIERLRDIGKNISPNTLRRLAGKAGGLTKGKNYAAKRLKKDAKDTGKVLRDNLKKELFDHFKPDSYKLKNPFGKGLDTVKDYEKIEKIVDPLDNWNDLIDKGVEGKENLDNLLDDPNMYK